MPVAPLSGKSAGETFKRTRQTTISKRSNAVQSVEGAGTESISTASRTRGISMRWSTRSRYVVAFFSSRQNKTTRWQSVNRFREERVENRATARRASPIARSMNRRSRDFGRASILLLLTSLVSRGFNRTIRLYFARLSASRRRGCGAVSSNDVYLESYLSRSWLAW